MLAYIYIYVCEIVYMYICIYIYIYTILLLTLRLLTQVLLTCVTAGGEEVEVYSDTQGFVHRAPYNPCTILSGNQTVKECVTTFTYFTATSGGTALICYDKQGNGINVSADSNVMQFSLYDYNAGSSNFTCTDTANKIKGLIIGLDIFALMEDALCGGNKPEFLAQVSVICDIVNGVIPSSN